MSLDAAVFLILFWGLIIATMAITLPVVLREKKPPKQDAKPKEEESQDE